MYISHQAYKIYYGKYIHIPLFALNFNSKTFLYKRGIVYPIWYKSLLDAKFKPYKTIFNKML